MRRMKDFVLAPETGEERKAAQTQHADGISGESDRHELTQAAQATDILLLVTPMNDRAGTEKEQGLEEGVRDEMKHAHGDAAHAQAQHHEAELRNRRVG